VLKLLHDVFVDVLVEVAQIQQLLETLSQSLLLPLLLKVRLQLIDALVSRCQLFLLSGQFLLVVFRGTRNISGQGLFGESQFLKQSVLFCIGCLQFLLQSLLQVLQ
jgi:hypothetical protein